MAEIITSFMYSADHITYYEKTSKNIFRHIIAKKKRKELFKKFDKIRDIVVTKDLLIEFITIYNGSFETILFDNIYSRINDSTKVYTLKIKSESGITVQVNTINSVTYDVINVTINRNTDNFSKVVACHDKLKTEGETKELVESVNDTIVCVIEQYLRAYIFGER